MKTEQIRLFMYKPPSGGRTCELVADQGLGSTVVVRSWTREECEAAADPPSQATERPNLPADLEEAAQEYANQTGEPTRFLLRWLDLHDHVKKSAQHNAAPERKDGAIAGTPLSANAIITELLNALLQQSRIMPTAMQTVLQANERTLATQLKVIESLAQLEQARPLNALPAELVRTTEEVEAIVKTNQLKQAALQKLVDLGPDVFRLGLAAIARAMELDPDTVAVANTAAESVQ